MRKHPRDVAKHTVNTDGKAYWYGVLRIYTADTHLKQVAVLVVVGVLGVSRKAVDHLYPIGDAL